jgi:hypothetical protein
MVDLLGAIEPPTQLHPNHRGRARGVVREALMRFDLPDLSALHNESDVEQKLVYPLLVADEPFGFGIVDCPMFCASWIVSVAQRAM